MLLAPRTHSTAADLLRLLAAWLAAIVLVQGLAAAAALGSGPLHRHGESASAVQHAHHHDEAERHHHKAFDASLVAVVEEGAFDNVAFAITAALALMAFAFRRSLPDARQAVRRAAPGWAWRTAVLPAPHKPPRLG